MKLLIAIPVYISDALHLEFTEKTVRSIKTSHEHEVLLIVNYCDPRFSGILKDLAPLAYNKENNVSSAWNYGMDEGKRRSVDYVLIPNNDVVFHSKCIDNLVTFAEEQRDLVIWSASEYADLRTLESAKPQKGFDDHPHFSCFMMKPQLQFALEQKEHGTKEPKPGYFDENFKPAYMEDNDMHNRILRAGWSTGKTLSALFYHFGSRTIKVDEKLYTDNKNTHRMCAEYFIKKWGFNANGVAVNNDDPVRFKYKGPFEPK